MNRREAGKIEILQCFGALPNIGIALHPYDAYYYAYDKNTNKSYITLEEVWDANFNELKDFALTIANFEEPNQKREAYSIISKTGYLFIESIDSERQYTIFYNPSKKKYKYMWGSYYDRLTGQWSQGHYDYKSVVECKGAIYTRLAKEHATHTIIVTRTYVAGSDMLPKYEIEKYLDDARAYNVWKWKQEELKEDGYTEIDVWDELAVFEKDGRQVEIKIEYL